MREMRQGSYSNLHLIRRGGGEAVWVELSVLYNYREHSIHRHIRQIINFYLASSKVSECASDYMYSDMYYL